MFMLVSIAWLTALLGFAFPPLWIVTALCVRGMIRIGRVRHADAYAAEQLELHKTYLAWSK